MSSLLQGIIGSEMGFVWTFIYYKLDHPFTSRKRMIILVIITMKNYNTHLRHSHLQVKLLEIIRVTVADDGLDDRVRVILALTHFEHNPHTVLVKGNQTISSHYK